MIFYQIEMNDEIILQKRISNYCIFQVNCEWSEWQEGECNKTCGGGNRTKSRHIKVQAVHGGRACVGSDTTTESCNVNKCPGK